MIAMSERMALNISVKRPTSALVFLLIEIFSKVTGTEELLTSSPSHPKICLWNEDKANGI